MFSLAMIVTPVFVLRDTPSILKLLLGQRFWFNNELRVAVLTTTI
jgi:hypothetical protein